jgi:hypothetical protein
MVHDVTGKYMNIFFVCAMVYSMYQSYSTLPFLDASFFGSFTTTLDYLSPEGIIDAAAPDHDPRVTREQRPQHVHVWYHTVCT